VTGTSTAGQARAGTADPLRVWRLAWVIVFGAFASGLDTSLANIGLRTIAADLHADLAVTQWVTSAYLLALAVSLPVCGWAGRRIGVGRLWLAALATFTVASGLCATASVIGMLIAFRVVQGLAAGLLIPAGQTILGQAFGPARLGRAMATLGIAVSLAPALGPVVGGLMLHALSWQWLFLINLPIGAAGLALGWHVLPRGHGGQAGALDWIGLGFVSAGLALVVYALSTVGTGGTLAGTNVLTPLALGLLGLAAFVRRARGRRHPLLDLRLYANRGYTAATVTAGCIGAMVFGSPLLFPLYFQLAHHDGVIGTGLRLLSLGIGTAAGVPIAGRLTDRCGGGIVAMAGTFATAVLTAPFALLDVTTAGPALLQVLLFALGAAIGLAAVPPGVAAYQAVTADQLPDATTGVNITQRLGGALGAALYAVVLARTLPAGTQHAFRIAFWWQTAICLAALTSATWLWRTPRTRPI
jgi:EmrB/QacA subfamily drug resistance transporter